MPRVRSSANVEKHTITLQELKWGPQTNDSQDDFLPSFGIIVDNKMKGGCIFVDKNNGPLTAVLSALECLVTFLNAPLHVLRSLESGKPLPNQKREYRNPKKFPAYFDRRPSSLSQRSLLQPLKGRLPHEKFKDARLTWSTLITWALLLVRNTLELKFSGMAEENCQDTESPSQRFRLRGAEALLSRPHAEPLSEPVSSTNEDPDLNRTAVLRVTLQTSGVLNVAEVKKLAQEFMSSLMDRLTGNRSLLSVCVDVGPVSNDSQGAAFGSSAPPSNLSLSNTSRLSVDLAEPRSVSSLPVAPPPSDSAPLIFAPPPLSACSRPLISVFSHREIIERTYALYNLALGVIEKSGSFGRLKPHTERRQESPEPENSEEEDEESAAEEGSEDEEEESAAEEEESAAEESAAKEEEELKIIKKLKRLEEQALRKKKKKKIVRNQEPKVWLTRSFCRKGGVMLPYGFDYGRKRSPKAKQRKNKRLISVKDHRSAKKQKSNSPTSNSTASNTGTAVYDAKECLSEGDVETGMEMDVGIKNSCPRSYSLKKIRAKIYDIQVKGDACRFLIACPRQGPYDKVPNKFFALDVSAYSCCFQVLQFVGSDQKRQTRCWKEIRIYRIPGWDWEQIVSEMQVLVSTICVTRSVASNKFDVQAILACVSFIAMLMYG